MAVDLFRSERLVYRHMQKPTTNPSNPEPEDVLAGYFSRSIWDPSMINMSPALWGPPTGNVSVHKLRELSTSNKLLTVYICLACDADTPGAVADPATPYPAASSLQTKGSGKQPQTSQDTAGVSASTSYIVPIGNMNLSAPRPPHSLHAHNRTSMIAIAIDAAYQGKRYGSEAIRWITDYGFRMAGLHRIGIDAVGWNMGAVRLYERIGFKREGVRREDRWFMGKFRDTVLMGMLEDEFWELEWVKDKDVRGGDGPVARMLVSG